LGLTLRRDHFPGPQPVAIELKNLPLKEEYMVCEKTDGERSILLMLQVNNKPMCFMINRKNEFYFMDFSFKKEVFEGSIFDGELIKTKKEKTWNYLIHDCMAYNGTSFIDFSHRLRYACVIDFIVKRYSNKKEDPVNIKTKLFYKYGPGISKTWDHIQKTTENEIDGLIFTPVDHPITFGRDNSLLKWKELNTVDFLVKMKTAKINLYYYKKTLVIYKSFKTDTDTYKKLVGLNVDLTKGVIIEFKISDNLENFTPYRIRTDKSKPNGEITVTNTLKNIQENIKIKDLFTTDEILPHKTA
jgi:hypothetical protein